MHISKCYAVNNSIIRVINFVNTKVNKELYFFDMSDTMISIKMLISVECQPSQVSLLFYFLVFNCSSHGSGLVNELKRFY